VRFIEASGARASPATLGVNWPGGCSSTTNRPATQKSKNGRLARGPAIAAFTFGLYPRSALLVGSSSATAREGRRRPWSRRFDSAASCAVLAEPNLIGPLPCGRPNADPSPPGGAGEFSLFPVQPRASSRSRFEFQEIRRRASARFHADQCFDYVSRSNEDLAGRSALRTRTRTSSR